MLIGLSAAITTGMLFTPPAAATSCVVEATVAARLGGQVGELKTLDSAGVLVRPCRGRVNDGDATVLFSRSAGITRLKVVRSGQDLRDEVPQPLAELAAPGGALATILNVIMAPRAQRPGSKRFDDVEALVLGGQLLAGSGLRLPLARFGWDVNQPAQLQGADRRLTSLVIERGVLILPALPPGTYRLTQGTRSAPIEALPAREFEGLEAELAGIGSTSPGPALQALRETLLFWEQGLLLNAVAANARR